MSDTEVDEAAVSTNVPEDVDTEIDEVEAHDSEVEEAAKHTPNAIPLRVDGLRKKFGGIVAVDDASFEVEAGSLTGLIGPNGAGKSTTFNCIAGVHEPTAGEISFQGESITGLSPDRV